jgi:molybdopterin converting factor small subunit
MGVKFVIPKYLQHRTNREATIEVKGVTVHECIEALIRQYPGLKGEILDDEGAILLKWMISINNKFAPSSGELSYRVEDGDEIMLLPVVDGG